MRSNKTTFGCYTSSTGLKLEPGQVCNYNGILPAGKPDDLVTIKEIIGFSDRDPDRIYAIGTYGELAHEIKIRLIDNDYKLTLVKDTPLVVKGRTAFDGRMVTSPTNTLRIGQTWQHYRGGNYFILGIGLDSDNPENFNQAVIQYCDTAEPSAMVWALTLNDWFKTVVLSREGNRVDEPRFQLMDNPAVEYSPYHKTLYELWQSIHKHVN